MLATSLGPPVHIGAYGVINILFYDTVNAVMGDTCRPIIPTKWI
jgi:hypothetical protein